MFIDNNFTLEVPDLTCLRNTYMCYEYVMSSHGITDSMINSDDGLAKAAYNDTMSMMCTPGTYQNRIELEGTLTLKKTNEEIKVTDVQIHSSNNI